MSHPATKNWGNVRVNPMQGIRVGDPTANRNAVKVLISGTEKETLAAIVRHRDNVAWLKEATELETSAVKPRNVVLALLASILDGKGGDA